MSFGTSHVLCVCPPLPTMVWLLSWGGQRLRRPLVLQAAFGVNELPPIKSDGGVGGGILGGFVLHLTCSCVFSEAQPVPGSAPPKIPPQRGGLCCCILSPARAKEAPAPSLRIKWGSTCAPPPQSRPAPPLPSLTKPGLMNPEQLLIKQLLDVNGMTPSRRPPQTPWLGHYQGVGGVLISALVINRWRSQSLEA